MAPSLPQCVSMWIAGQDSSEALSSSSFITSHWPAQFFRQDLPRTCDIGYLGNKLCHSVHPFSVPCVLDSAYWKLVIIAHFQFYQSFAQHPTRLFLRRPVPCVEPA
ncbi:hypothetical protein MPTK1_1g15510 [Marchantia polymorpha subsp. ruderalis]|uniref:Uncharacterized protein n=2 Tax=Marchantia polymorpha TaxID=3197 RepID=A0AAF6AQH3_MARPO|nr:hypothetical protein MARPO_0033s0110 [Marchantia polymorpha]BBM98693.1 hypothetical protein Mp_1g15510 [Marchantia polymorpha subsp. ruderalis]|eukprot:PTQ41714.1 hypothetical protein MARPO_0033s0110 [Marchantia polymorpha]